MSLVHDAAPRGHPRSTCQPPRMLPLQQLTHFLQQALHTIAETRGSGTHEERHVVAEPSVTTQDRPKEPVNSRQGDVRRDVALVGDDSAGLRRHVLGVERHLSLQAQEVHERVTGTRTVDDIEQHPSPFQMPQKFMAQALA
eukprot:CAMPEP_0180668902 /NCGR_PEP_ID=MMETSP1037_2-20121125/63187_1 /TAXON_ID=632150 /ORGANISM="Azadinium spinosum, Strain 3D9" /LENGTH=140 /DNA_ID=CAMNT_0022697691 /DNA_START=20 /DNA_END=439 /DNA_ORIENTATION=+